jgi:hypothetical protein
MKKINLVGQKFGRLIVLGKATSTNNKNSSWRCKCICGNEVIVTRPNLIQNHTKSCGCLNKDIVKTRCTTHGKTNSIVYKKWTDMKTRCTNSNTKGFKNYGGRGIVVCERWTKFENFLEDMGDPPENMTLERIDNEKGYSPENCKWATATEQANNKRNNIKIEFNGKTKSLRQWADEIGIPKSAISQRLLRGWSVRHVLTISYNESIKSITYNGVTKSLKDWSISLGGNIALVSIRLQNGWSIERAVTTKVG